jgi:hypothetical protein
MPLTALDNVALLETMISGKLVTEPSPAARSYFAEKRAALFGNPTANSAFFENAWLPWREAFSQPREWDSYTDKVAVRRSEYGATTVMVDAHDVPGSVQNNPNDSQNELRLRRYREDYRQATLWQNRDEFTPITVDSLEIARLLQNAGPDSDSVSSHVNAQLTQALNRDRAAEFHTLMAAVGRTAERAGIYHLQLPDLEPSANPDADDAREFAAVIRTAVLALADFVPFYTPAKNTMTVPAAQVRLIIRQSTMQRLGTLAYATSFNPEFVFALPQDQIVELPDHYFDRQAGLADQQAIIVDAGTDNAYGSLVVVDTFYGWGVDPYPIKSSENRALHHASILDVNPFKTFITAGTGAGTSIVLTTIVPDSITGSVYGPHGDIAPSGDLVRGQEYSTTAEVLDAAGFPAGGWSVAITGGASSHTKAGLYGTILIGLDETADSVTVTWTSLIDPTKTVSHSYNVTGIAAAYDGSGILVLGESVVFAPGTGAGGTITYTLGTGETGEITADGGTTWTPLGTSPIAVPAGETRSVRTTAASGYVFPDGETIHHFGPYTAA